jgi:hypothetical protein
MQEVSRSCRILCCKRVAREEMRTEGTSSGYTAAWMQAQSRLDIRTLSKRRTWQLGIGVMMVGGVLVAV